MKNLELEVHVLHEEFGIRSACRIWIREGPRILKLPGLEKKLQENIMTSSIIRSSCK